MVDIRMNIKTICLLLLGTFAISGCKHNDEPVKQEDNVPKYLFSSEYSHNDTRHWYPCTDEGYAKIGSVNLTQGMHDVFC